MSWELVFTKQAQKDAKKIAKSGLKEKAQDLLKILKENPCQNHGLTRNWLAIRLVLIPGESIYSID
ncbi:MAG: hypothetical protein R6V39_04110 [Desulfovibrionales bacterium]